MWVVVFDILSSLLYFIDRDFFSACWGTKECLCICNRRYDFKGKKLLHRKGLSVIVLTQQLEKKRWNIFIIVHLSNQSLSFCMDRYIAAQRGLYTFVWVFSFLTALLAWTHNSDLQILTTTKVLTFCNFESTPCFVLLFRTGEEYFRLCKTWLFYTRLAVFS